MSRAPTEVNIQWATRIDGTASTNQRISERDVSRLFIFCPGLRYESDAKKVPCRGVLFEAATDSFPSTRFQLG